MKDKKRSKYQKLPIRLIITAKDRFLEKTEVQPNGCIYFDGAPRESGHAYFNFGINGGKYRELAHRAAFVIHTGQEIPTELVVRHTCHTPLCVNPQHLKLGTHADNRQDCVDANRQAKGEQNGRSKLTQENVIDIIAHLQSGQMTVTSIAKAYGVDPKAIRSIRAKKTWTHVWEKLQSMAA